MKKVEITSRPIKKIKLRNDEVLKLRLKDDWEITKVETDILADDIDEIKVTIRKFRHDN